MKGYVQTNSALMEIEVIYTLINKFKLNEKIRTSRIRRITKN